LDTINLHNKCRGGRKKVSPFVKKECTESSSMPREECTVNERLIKNSYATDSFNHKDLHTEITKPTLNLSLTTPQSKHDLH
jgi:hypothetical protein